MTARYTDDELKAVAKIVVADENKKGHRSLHLFLTLAATCGISPNEARLRVFALAGEK